MNKEYEFEISCEGKSPIGFVTAENFKGACKKLKWPVSKCKLLDKKPKGHVWLI